jgi:hypothetical protein
MTSVIAGIARAGLAVLVGAILTIGASGEAAAKHRSGHVRANLHAHRVLANSHAELLSQEPARPGAMRYYGGPKSPMWRSPAEQEVVTKPVVIVQQQPTRSGSMRYYGGPKSPMWRGPAEN